MIGSCSPDYHLHSGAYKTIAGTKIYYEEYGIGSPLLILSGGGIDRSVRDFNQCITPLSKSFRLILPDSPGQGRSEQPDTLTYELLTGYFSHLIDSLDLDSVSVMGWSDGGIAALLLAASRPDKVKKVIAVGANNGLSGALPAGIDVNTVIPQSLEAWAIRNQQSVENYSKEVIRDWKKMMNSLNAMWYQPKYFPDSILSKIHVPVMIAQGDRDDISTIDHAVSLHRMIANSQLCILPGTGHELFMERPALIGDISTDFFK